MMRISRVNEVGLMALAFSSTFHIGDSCYIKADSKALAVKREFPRFYGNEGNFSAYKVFTENTPTPVITEMVSMQISNQNPDICVNRLTVNGVSSSSVLQIGSTQTICANSRVKHIRQLLGKHAKYK
ncbi:spore germination protein GerPE [Sutcliffiella halmapala]|uniref:spore germination protein GerPE n=1 Tax=Sutcliffiella halmapala TaxID=79882 RepID=UPI00099593BD|nr:spore germination protein GerPE [Sutcliffiella halmapala]